MAKYIIEVDVDEKRLIEEYKDSDTVEGEEPSNEFTIEQAIENEMGWVREGGISVISIKKGEE